MCVFFCGVWLRFYLNLVLESYVGCETREPKQGSTEVQAIKNGLEDQIPFVWRIPLKDDSVWVRVLDTDLCSYWWSTEDQLEIVKVGANRETKPDASQWVVPKVYHNLGGEICNLEDQGSDNIREDECWNDKSVSMQEVSMCFSDSTKFSIECTWTYEKHGNRINRLGWCVVPEVSQVDDMLRSWSFSHVLTWWPVRWWLLSSEIRLRAIVNLIALRGADCFEGNLHERVSAALETIHIVACHAASGNLLCSVREGTCIWAGATCTIWVELV